MIFLLYRCNPTVVIIPTKTIKYLYTSSPNPNHLNEDPGFGLRCSVSANRYYFELHRHVIDNFILLAGNLSKKPKIDEVRYPVLNSLYGKLMEIKSAVSAKYITSSQLEESLNEIEVEVQNIWKSN